MASRSRLRKTQNIPVDAWHRRALHGADGHPRRTAARTAAEGVTLFRWQRQGRFDGRGHRSGPGVASGRASRPRLPGARRRLRGYTVSAMQSATIDVYREILGLA